MARHVRDLCVPRTLHPPLPAFPLSPPCLPLPFRLLPYLSPPSLCRYLTSPFFILSFSRLLHPSPAFPVSSVTPPSLRLNYPFPPFSHRPHSPFFLHCHPVHPFLSFPSHHPLSFSFLASSSCLPSHSFPLSRSPSFLPPFSCLSLSLPSPSYRPLLILSNVSACQVFRCTSSLSLLLFLGDRGRYASPPPLRRFPPPIPSNAPIITSRHLLCISSGCYKRYPTYAYHSVRSFTRLPRLVAPSLLYGTSLRPFHSPYSLPTGVCY